MRGLLIRRQDFPLPWVSLGYLQGVEMNEAIARTCRLAKRSLEFARVSPLLPAAGPLD